MASFMECPRTETWLKQRGVKFEYRQQVRFDELMPNWFAVNQGRPDAVPKDESLIEKYATGMDHGSIFPSPLIAQTSLGLEVLDGCQRLCAAELCGQKLFNAYVIKSDNPGVRASIRVCANCLNGTAPSQEWTIGKIVDILYEQYGFGVVDCSQWSGQPEKKIQIEIDSRDAAKWLRIQGVDCSVKPANQKGFLAALSHLAPMLDRAKLTKEIPDLVRQLQSAKANNDEAIHLLTECLDVDRNKKVDLAIQVKSRVAEVMSRPEIQSRMSGKRTIHPIDSVLRSLTGTLTVMRTAVRGEHHTDAQQSEELLRLLVETGRLAKRLVPRELRPALAEAMQGKIAEEALSP